MTRFTGFTGFTGFYFLREKLGKKGKIKNPVNSVFPVNHAMASNSVGIQKRLAVVIVIAAVFI